MMDSLKIFVDKWKNKPGFPNDYCNPAAAELAKELSQLGIKTTKCFTYKKPGEGHTFLKDESGKIIDPTYGQFDPNYVNGFEGDQFPDPDLQKNQLSGEEFVKLQQKRFEQGLYNQL